MRKIGRLRIAALLLFCALLYTSLVFAQDRKITGKITDDKNIPLVGATVLVKGTNLVTSTDQAGNFTLTLPQGRRTLVVSYVGMEQQEVSVANGNEVAVTLSATGAALTDV